MYGDISNESNANPTDGIVHHGGNLRPRSATGMGLAGNDFSVLYELVAVPDSGIRVRDFGWTFLCQNAKHGEADGAAEGAAAMNLREFALWVYAALTKLWNRIFTDETRISSIEKEQDNMLQQLQDLDTAAKNATAAISNAVTVVGQQTTTIKSLNDQIATLKAQTSVSVEDLATLEADGKALAAQNTALGAALTPPAA